MRIYGNELTCMQGESFQVNRNVINQDESPFVASIHLANPYIAWTVSSADYYIKKTYRKTWWQPLEKPVAGTKTPFSEYKGSVLFDNTEIFDLDTGYPDATSWSDVDIDLLVVRGYAVEFTDTYPYLIDGIFSHTFNGKKEYKFITVEYADEEREEPVYQWSDYNFSISNIFSSYVTEEWNNLSYYYGISLLDGAITLDLMQDWLDRHHYPIIASKVDWTNVEYWSNKYPEIYNTIINENPSFYDALITNKPITSYNEVRVLLEPTTLTVERALNRGSVGSAGSDGAKVDSFDDVKPYDRAYGRLANETEDSEIDLRNYVTDGELDDTLEDYVTDSELAEELQGYVTDTEFAQGLNQKLDKYTGTLQYSLYARTPAGNTNLSYSSAPTAYAMMQRDANGRSQVEVPSADKDIANKEYVDDVASETCKVQSVNGKTGQVVLNASDILVQNSRTVQQNLERIDGEIEDLVDDKVDKQTLTTGVSVGAYVETAQGTALTPVVTTVDTSDPGGNSIVRRDSSGRIHALVSDQDDFSAVVNIGYLEDHIGDKLDKVSITGDYDRAYVADSDGDQTMVSISDSVVNNALVRRDNNGRIALPSTFTQSNEAVSKQYVDTKVSESVASIGRFLSGWNCTTGKPSTDPTSLPYTYKTGDHYTVKVVPSAGGTAYKPNGASYTGAASTTVDTESPRLNDVYLYDGTSWSLFRNSEPALDNYYTKTEVDAELDLKLDATTQAIATVGGLVLPTTAPTGYTIVGIGATKAQEQIYLGSDFTLTVSASSKKTLKVGGVDASSATVGQFLRVVLDGQGNKISAWQTVPDWDGSVT